MEKKHRSKGGGSYWCASRAREKARRAHENALDTVVREEVLADMSMEVSLEALVQEVGLDTLRRTNRSASSQSHPVIPDDDGMLALVSFLSDGQQDSQIPE